MAGCIFVSDASLLLPRLVYIRSTNQIKKICSTDDYKANFIQEKIGKKSKMLPEPFPKIVK